MDVPGKQNPKPIRGQMRNSRLVKGPNRKCSAGWAANISGEKRFSSRLRPQETKTKQEKIEPEEQLIKVGNSDTIEQ